MRLEPSLGQTFEKSKFCKMAKPFKGFGITLKISCLLLFYSLADFASSLNLENKPAIVDPETLTDQVTTLSPSKNVDWNDWETWTPSPEISKAFPYYRMGYDNDGIVAYVWDFGKWDFRDWSGERLDELWKYFEQMIRFRERDFKANGGRGVVQIVDFDGFELNHHTSPSAIKMALLVFTSFNRLHDVTKYGFYLNVNYGAEMFLNLARPFIGGMIDKYEGYGTNVKKWKPLFMKQFPADQIPPKYGGTNKNWKPLPLWGA